VFTINHFLNKLNSNDCIELRNSDNSCYAKIDLSLGGSLQELKLGNKTIIVSENEPNGGNKFMSSILFPFANRIENGKYRFNNRNFELYQNETDRQNALHGLVFDKAFNFLGESTFTDHASLFLYYEETMPTKGFPFKFRIALQYVLSENALELRAEIKNMDKDEFPFSLGWHPYFKSNDLYNSFLGINSNKKILVNEKMIPNGETEIKWKGFLKIEDKAFDDCFVLNTNTVEFKTPEYHVELVISSGENYLQLYTPNDRKSIAIEPQTAPANCFNSRIGLQTLSPNEVYRLSWKVNLK